MYNKDSITITREQFREVVNKCNANFELIVGSLDDTPAKALETKMMVLQNDVFSFYLEWELFDSKYNK